MRAQRNTDLLPRPHSVSQKQMWDTLPTSGFSWNMLESDMNKDIVHSISSLAGAEASPIWVISQTPYEAGKINVKQSSSEFHREVKWEVLTGAGTRCIASSIVFTCIYMKETEMMEIFWNIYEVTRENLLNSLVKFLWERRDVVRISQNSAYEKQSQNNLVFPFCCEMILLAAWFILWDHKLCLKQFSTQKSFDLNSTVVCTFACNLC